MNVNKRILKEKTGTAICALAAICTAAMLFIIIGQIAWQALPSLTPYFILTPENKAPGVGNGIANAIAGTVLISLLSTMFAAPFALGTAIYLKRYSPDNWATRTIRFMIEVLSGTPSIVIGMFGLLVLAYYLKPFTGGFSLIAGSVALAILTMPVIERAIETAMDTVGTDLEEGSYALGATKWQTLRMTTIPAAITGIITGFILGFGRAAEESSVVILTAGFSQYLPEFAIKANDKFFLGVKIYPFNDLVGTLPYAIYNAYENSNVIKMSSAYGAAFVLICIVLLVNVSAKIILLRGFSSGKTGSSGILAFLRKHLERGENAAPDTTLLQNVVETGVPDTIMSGEKKEDNSEISWTQKILLQGTGALSSTSGRLNKKTSKKGEAEQKKTMATDEETAELPARSECEKDNGYRNETARLETPASPKFPPKRLGVLSCARIRQWFSKLRHPLPKPAGPLPQGQSRNAEEMPKKSPGRFGKAFLLTLIPFALLAGVLLVLSLVMPGFGTGLSAGPVAFIALLIVTIIAGLVCTFAALFLRRILLRSLKKKSRLPVSRAGTTAALGTGICIVFACAFLFSAHTVLPDSGAGGQQAGSLSGLANPLSLFGLGNSTAKEPVNRTAQLAALLAEEGEEGTASTPPAAASTAAPVAATPAVTAAVTPSVPLKDALSLREIYQYGNPDRRCLATVYNTTALPFYFWWLIDYNRFVPETPAPGNKFLVVFLRIENDGNKSAIVPSADAITVTYQGTTYTHEPYFNTSYLSDWQIDYYESHLDKLPYQWIREIGPMKRDYAYLTGYNIFGENWTTTDNETTVYQTGFDINGKGFFIQPGSSNAIDGYLIYEVPDYVANDLRNAYVQVAFNSISSTRWRLGT